MTDTEDAPVIVCLTNGQFEENCYLIGDPSSNDAVIVDPGEDSGMFLDAIKQRGWHLKGIWLTHAHVDHVTGVAAVKQATGVPVYLHPDDRQLYDHVAEQGAWLGLRAEPAPAPDHELHHGDRLTVGRFEFLVRHTPGHSPGSVSFVGHGAVFGGDVLFRESVGRVDLPGGDATTLMATIRDHFLTLPENTVVYSGHGPPTTIGYERDRNPFLTGVFPLA